jgi:hypothetical protein
MVLLVYIAVQPSLQRPGTCLLLLALGADCACVCSIGKVIASSTRLAYSDAYLRGAKTAVQLSTAWQCQLLVQGLSEEAVR